MYEDIDLELNWFEDCEDLDEFLIKHHLSEEYNKIYEESDDDEEFSMKQLFKKHFDTDTKRYLYVYEADSENIQVYYMKISKKEE
jgi:hypothetical protein